MKTIIIFITLLFFNCGWVFGQQLTPQVMSVAGNVSSNQILSLDWTIGELSISSHETNNGLYTQGFHQPSAGKSDLFETTLISENSNADWTLSVFPNPTVQKLSLQTMRDLETPMIIQLFNSSGDLLMQKETLCENCWIDIEMNEYLSGMYIVRAYDQAKNKTYSCRVIKIK